MSASRRRNRTRKGEDVGTTEPDTSTPAANSSLSWLAEEYHRGRHPALLAGVAKTCGEHVLRIIKKKTPGLQQLDREAIFDDTLCDFTMWAAGKLQKGEDLRPPLECLVGWFAIRRVADFFRSEEEWRKVALIGDTSLNNVAEARDQTLAEAEDNGDHSPTSIGVPEDYCLSSREHDLVATIVEFVVECHAQGKEFPKKGFVPKLATRLAERTGQNETTEGVKGLLKRLRKKPIPPVAHEALRLYREAGASDAKNRKARCEGVSVAAGAQGTT
jgi:hypothetical protein